MGDGSGQAAQTECCWDLASRVTRAFAGRSGGESRGAGGPEMLHVWDEGRIL